MTKRESELIKNYSDNELSEKILNKWDEFMNWKTENSTIYIKEQILILEKIKNDFIFKNEKEFNQFVAGYFADRFRIQYFVDTYIYKTVFRLNELYNSIHSYLN